MRTTRWLATATLLLGLAAVPACSSKNDKVTPPVTLELNSGNINGSATFPHVFATAGTFPYHCSIHPSTMTGSVTVSSGSPMAVSVSIVNMTTGFNPSTVTVGVGGTVTWTNNDVIAHTVTSN